jgi:poly-gamma-glutamate capsule biosynthesis protein CapA/YwtB (metallophosphatase superfamily)
MRLALAGDTMLGRGVADVLRKRPPESLFAPELVEIARSADLCILNLECCISGRGRPDPRRIFSFRAPPAAVDALVHLGVDCVTLANNHALDYGPDALLDTLEHLRAAGIATVGAGADVEEARRPVVLGGLSIVAVTDHPADYAAGADRPGVAFADLSAGAPEWLLDTIRSLNAKHVLVSPHWGPNMVSTPLPYIRRAAHAFVNHGATVVAGHSAHVFHGLEGRVLYDLGDFLDDYRVDPELRNDLGLLVLVDLEEEPRIETVPLKLEYAHTRLAEGEDAAWIRRRFREASAALEDG